MDVRTCEGLLDAYSNLSDTEKKEFDRRFLDLLKFRKLLKRLVKTIGEEI